MTYVAYLRVSTDRQGRSGLGLEAQRAIIHAHIGENIVLKEFVEIESGRNNARPMLQTALALAKSQKATLVVAKLDRLGRDAAFVSGILASGIDFCAADMPQANRFVLQILAAVAEYEAKLISDRTKAALAACKARGKALGGRREGAGRRKSAIVNVQKRDVAVLACQKRAVGMTFGEIATEFAAIGVKTPRGFNYDAAGVYRLTKGTTTCLL